MNDDTESRLRDALGSGDLPDAPESLRRSLNEIAASRSQAPARQVWLGALPTLAAVVVVAVVVGALSSGCGRLGPATSTAEVSTSAGALASAGSGATLSAAAWSGAPTAPVSGSPLLNTGFTVYTPAELEASLASGRAAWIAKAVIVDGSIDESILPSCAPGSAGCTMGRLSGTTELVSATRYTGQLLKGRVDLSARSIMAMVVREYGLEYLGEMGRVGSATDFQASVADLADLGQGPYNGPSTFIVSAWLAWTGPLPCPSFTDRPPADTPFEHCPMAWLLPRNESVVPTGPSDGVSVQPGAYEEYAASLDTPGLGPVPRYGTYLVRLVVDTRQGANGPRGWQVVARLAP